MHSSKFSSVALRRETREESRQKNDTKFTSLITTTSYVERQNVLIPQGVSKVYEWRNWIGNTSRIKESRKLLDYDHSVGPEQGNVAWVCGCSFALPRTMGLSMN